MASELPAGDELDRLVAEQVLGMVPCDAWEDINFGSAGGPAQVKRCSHAHCYSVRSTSSMFGVVGGPPRVSQDWTAMGALVAHLVGQHWLVSMTAMADGLFGASCELRQGEMPPSQRPMACGDTVPHAIARAALQTARPPAPGVE